MFSRPEFETPPNSSTSPTPFLKNRGFGLVLLAIAVVAILLFALSTDSAVFTPYNAARSSAATATALTERGQRHPGVPVLPPGHPAIPTPASPRDLGQSA
jgi:hypothetical protein